MKFYLFIATLLLSSVSLATDACDRMVDLTCSPGTLDDGTGATKAPSIFQTDAAQLLQKIQKDVHDDFVKKLATTPTFELQYALSATGAYARPECQSTHNGQAPNMACKQIVAEGLTSKVLMDLANKRDSSQPIQTDLSDEYHLRQTSLYTGMLDKYSEELEQQTGIPEVEKHLKENLLPKVKGYLTQVIREKVPDPQAQRIMLNKINAIRFGGTDCSGNGGGLNSEFLTNAFYLANNKFFFCKGYARLGLSDFSAVHIMAHELAHSIDPCFIDVGPTHYKFKYNSSNPAAMEQEYPVKTLISCLRSAQSVNALADIGAATEGESTVHESELYSPVRRAGQAPSVEDEGEVENPFCHNDQIGESTCDWFATEVLAKYSNNHFKKLNQQQFALGVANIYRPMCNANSGLRGPRGMGVHPMSADRLNKLVLTHPHFRQKLGCDQLNPSREIYCDGKSYVAPVPIERFDSSEVDQ